MVEKVECFEPELQHARFADFEIALQQGNGLEQTEFSRAGNQSADSEQSGNFYGNDDYEGSNSNYNALQVIAGRGSV